MHSRSIALRIKRIYFDAIARGEKTVEYRESKPFYDRMFARKKSIALVLFHYQRAERLLCEVEKIERIKTPKEIAFAILTPYCYAIHLGGYGEFKKGQYNEEGHATD